MDVRCGVVCTARLPGVQGTVLYEGSDVRTMNGFVLPRDRGLECASPKYRQRNSVIIIASLREYKRAFAMPLPTLTQYSGTTSTTGRRGSIRNNSRCFCFVLYAATYVVMENIW